MQQLIRSLYPVQTALFGPRRTSFEGLAEALQSEVLFIACSDSRINPNVLTRNEPGEPLILRFAGNIVPTQGAAWSGEAASNEFAVSEHRLAASSISSGQSGSEASLMRSTTVSNTACSDGTQGLARPSRPS